MFKELTKLVNVFGIFLGMLVAVRFPLLGVLIAVLLMVIYLLGVVYAGKQEQTEKETSIQN